MTFDDALAFLSERIDFERFRGSNAPVPGTKRIEGLMEALDFPQRTFPSVHVTGTNGKFSVCAMTTAILAERGLTIGTYSSPHLESITERIAINGVPISEDAFGAVVAYLKPFVELVELRMGERLTHFEMLTAMAIEHFFDAPVHAGVIEVGLGGEYDATNVVDGKVAVLTKVSRDHLDRFGDDPVQAAWEKSGIIKKDAVVLSGVDQPALAQVVSDRAAERGAARVARLGRDFDVLSRSPAVGGQLVGIHGLEADYADVYLPVFGEHQAVNLAFATAAAEAFLEGPLRQDTLVTALAGVQMPARLEVVCRRPVVVVDGGHNEDATAAVLRTIADEFAFDRLVCVVGMLEDKPVEDVLALLHPVVDRFVVAAPSFERAAAPARLVAALEELGVPEEMVGVRPTVAEGIALALEQAGPEDLVLVFGSMYTAGEARSWLRRRAADRRT